MKPYIRLGALGFSAPIPISYQENTFAVGLAGIPSSNANLTWGVQHTFGDTGPDGEAEIQASQALTVLTITDNRLQSGIQGHGLSVADSVVLRGISGVADGSYQVATVVSQTSYTVTALSSQTLTAVQGFAKNFRWFNHVSLVTQTGRLDGNYAFPVRAVRLNVSVYVAGYVDLMILQGSSR